MTVRTSSPAARARAASSARPAGVMMNWSAASTSSAANGPRAAVRRSRAAAAGVRASAARRRLRESASIVSHDSVDAIKRHVAARAQVGAEVSGAPQRADRRVAAAAPSGTACRRRPSRRASTPRARHTPQPQRGQIAVRRDLVAALAEGQRVGVRERRVHRRFVAAEMDRGSQRQPHRPVPSSRR